MTRTPSLHCRRPRNSYRPQLDALEDRCLLSTYLVDSLTDASPGGGGQGTALAGDLRYCITQANTVAGDDTITFSVTGTINLAGALPNLSSNIDLDGPGPDLLTVRRDTGGQYRIFTIESGRTVSISGLTIANGSVLDGQGGGIWNGGTLAMNNCVLSGNTASRMPSPSLGVFGGGIFNSGGALTLSNCTISGNIAEISGGFVSSVSVSGGGIYTNGGSVTVSNSTISGNSARRSGGIGSDTSVHGGAFYNSSGSLSINNCTISGNSTVGAFSSGSVLYSTSGTLAFTSCSVTGNSGAFIAIWYSSGTVTISKCTLSANAASEACIEGIGTLSVSDTTISGNGGYGIWNSGTAMISNSTISGNNGYAFRNNQTLTVTNSTIANNTLGGIANVAFSSDATATFRNVTVANNGGNQLRSISGFGTPVPTATIQLRNVIVSSSGAQPNFFTGPGGTIVSQGHNLSSDNASGFLTGPGDLINSNPLLGPLQDNGGRTFTHALLPGSPALNAGSQLRAPARH